MGAGFRRGSDLFQTASELLKTKEESEAKLVEEEEDCAGPQGNHPCDSGLGNGDTGFENEKKVTKEACTSAGGAVQVPENKGQQPNDDSKVSLWDNPTKKAKPTKKQQLLAEAARKESQDISKFFSLSKAVPKVSGHILAERDSSPVNELPQSSLEEKQDKLEPQRKETQEDNRVSAGNVLGQSQTEDPASRKTDGFESSETEQGSGSAPMQAEQDSDAKPR